MAGFLGRADGPSRRPRLAPPRAQPRRAPTRQQASYLRSGLGQPGFKLPLFDAEGRPVGPRLIDACVVRGWAEAWFDDPRLPGWRVCRLTDSGLKVVLGRDAPQP